MKKFPSPIGELHFSIELIDCKEAGTRAFPSPIGELHFSILSQIGNAQIGTKLFPSPIGELHFSIFKCFT